MQRNSGSKVSSGLPVGVRDDSPVFAAALIAALRRPAAWGTTALGIAVMSLFAATPVYRFIDAKLEHRYAPGEMRFNLSENFWTDHAAGIDVMQSQLATTAGFLALTAFLFGCFTAGGWLRLLLDPGRGYGRLFFAGGARYFWRFLRLALIVLLLFHLVGVATQGALWQKVVLEGWAGWAEGNGENASSELTVQRLIWASDALHLAGLSLVLAWAILTRTRMVLENRRSAFLAGGMTFWMLLRHPIATLRPMIVLVAIEFAGLLGLAFVFRALERGLAGGSGLWSFVPMVLVALFALVLREILHGARYAAALLVARRLVRPMPTDPWSDRVGGPGGPQYPLADSDEFSVAM